MASLHRTEKQLAHNLVRATIYNQEVDKLLHQGYVTRLTPKEETQTSESWYIPYHLVEHNGKPHLVFNCSFKYQGHSLNEYLLPGPMLVPSLIGVLLHFRQFQHAISGDIKSMFHQIRLLPDDRPLLRFLWRHLDREARPGVYEWQVLPFSTTSSPCCAICVVQAHAQSLQPGNEDVLQAVL